MEELHLQLRPVGTVPWLAHPDQNPEKDGWALRIFQNIFFFVLAFSSICFQSTRVTALPFFFPAVWPRLTWKSDVQVYIVSEQNKAMNSCEVDRIWLKYLAKKILKSVTLIYTQT